MRIRRLGGACASRGRSEVPTGRPAGPSPRARRWRRVGRSAARLPRDDPRGLSLEGEDTTDEVTADGWPATDWCAAPRRGRHGPRTASMTCPRRRRPRRGRRPSGPTTSGVPAVARLGLAGADDEAGVLDRAGAVSRVRQCVDLAVAGQPRGRHDEHLGPGVDQAPRELGEAQVVAGHQPDLPARDVDDDRLDRAPGQAGRTRGSRRSRRGGSCGTPPRCRPPDDEGVERPAGIVGDLEHPGHDGGSTVAVGHARQLGANGPSTGSAKALTSGPGLTEVAGEGLRQHDQVGARRDRLGEPGAVGGGVEPARPLVDADPQRRSAVG